MSSFTAEHRGGEGPPLFALHGITDTWRTWELVLPRLEPHFEVLAPTLPGHAGGPPLGDTVSLEQLTDFLETKMNEAGMKTAHIVGNSLGGHLAFRLAARGRARSVCAFAPAGGWAEEAGPPGTLFDDFEQTYANAKAGFARLGALAATPEGRRLATRSFVVNYEHLSRDLVLHLLEGVALCDGEKLVEYGRRADWGLDLTGIECPVRLVWGEADQILPYPESAAGLRRGLPHAEWVELEDVGHCPQLDVPLESAELIRGFAASG